MQSLLFCAGLLLAPAAWSVSISAAEAQRIGHLVWQNECGGTTAGLTSWNAGEDFASLGIGHFIWYPEGVRGPFEESFPPLLTFVAARGGSLPEFLSKADAGCPWHSRQEFEAARSSPEMRALREFLAGTVALQAQFLVTRLEASLPKMEAQSRNPGKIRRQFERVGQSAQGCYALVDYVNFKGEGTSRSEHYQGQGWGLLQVLESMDESHSATQDFAAAAQAVLQRRVANAPPERGEKRWLAGWLRRVNSYRSHP